MKEIPIPADKSAAAKKQSAMRRGCIFVTVLFFFFAAVAILSLIGLLVSVMVFELKGLSSSPLFPILAGSFAGGALLCALGAFGLSKLSAALSSRQKDFAERCDSEESFFVGDNVLATFSEDALCIHGQGGGQVIWVPYAQMRILSVCTSRAPREKGEWSVVFESPARYLAKKPEKDAPPALVQADAKERLYRAIEKHGLTLLGEKPPRGQKAPRQKFVRRERFVLPDRQRRRRALIGIVAGGVIVAGGIVAAIFWHTFIGSLAVAVGVVLVMRSTMSFVRARAALSLYREGILWKNTPKNDSFFLKWEEIEAVTRTEQEGAPVLLLKCMYGEYPVPELDGSAEAVEKMYGKLQQ